ncbi:MAG: hypothetical protein ACE5HF_08160 [Gemmatimonadota bacterium]
MQKRPRRVTPQTRSLALALGLLAPGIGGCRGEPPPMPGPGTFSWRTYENRVIGYRVEVPDIYRPDVSDDGSSVIFRWEGAPPVKVYFTDAAAARKRGLWVRHEPSGEIRLGGRSGRLYEYEHWDGPFVSAIRAYVVAHRGRELGLEFRAVGELNEVNRHILESFRFTPDASRGL